jgi:predicted nucleic acid-binding protein
MELFIDTSALVKFYYPEPGSEDVEALLLAAERVFVSRLSIVEMASALAKKLRSSAIGKDDETRIWNAFQDDLRSGSVKLIHLDEELIARATTLIRDLGAPEGLRTLDALQLASAMNQRGTLFLSADRRLARIAVLVGLGIPPPRSA